VDGGELIASTKSVEHLSKIMLFHRPSDLALLA
jgi:hypothetical protein